jgi:tyrosine-protein phosphatase
MEEEDQEPNFDIPQSREEKPAAYPHGPICIYESGVYLYFEPTAEQAANYDVIMNVASEVKNPFTSKSDSQEDLDARRKDGPPAETVDFAAIPEHAKPAPAEKQNSSPTSPTTPKATPILEGSQEPEHQANGSFLKRPEYIHIPWEHNTDIVPDLYRLVKIMEDRVSQGKRVLVHCQCGVSRSASLIVAYGLYKNPGISVQEAYDAVKKRSKWIGPNMNLIMQLQEFRNGLLRANGDRAFHNQGYGLPLSRKSAGLPSSRSAGNNPLSPFDRDVPSGSRTPHTAPLPEDNDVTMQRASTGNMISLSPGPLSAPSGVFFSPGFRRSWASSQTHFDLSPKSSPVVPVSATPYVDPKGHVVPVLSVTHSDPTVISVPLNLEPTTQSQDQMALKPLPVPNFSRPVKKSSEQDAAVEDVKPLQSPRSDVFHTAPLRQESYDDLQSPTASSFNLVAAASESEYPNITALISPRTFEFPSKLYSDDLHTPPSPRTMEPHSGQNATWDQQASAQPEVMSPTVSAFPSDIFPAADDPVALDMASPRAAEFHMTPLRPRVQDEDPFHLASPRNFEFPRDVFDDTQHTPPRDTAAEARSHVQAILPPAHLNQPQSFNGFASLNSTAQTHPIVSVQSPEMPSISPLRIDSLSTPVDEPHTPDLPVTDRGQGVDALPEAEALHPVEESPRRIRKTPERPLLTTPGGQSSIKTRFSSPNMREQRKLHKIQTEMEALLPPRSPGLPHALDDIDALRSPRATEFTRNPFHVDLSSPVDEPSPVSSNETIKDSMDHREWRETFTWTPPRPIAEDPRSPVQTNSSPIVRNIWDVL